MSSGSRPQHIASQVTAFSTLQSYVDTTIRPIWLAQLLPIAMKLSGAVAKEIEHEPPFLTTALPESKVVPIFVALKKSIDGGALPLQPEPTDAARNAIMYTTQLEQILVCLLLREKEVFEQHRLAVQAAAAAGTPSPIPAPASLCVLSDHFIGEILRLIVRLTTFGSERSSSCHVQQEQELRIASIFLIATLADCEPMSVFKRWSELFPSGVDPTKRGSRHPMLSPVCYEVFKVRSAAIIAVVTVVERCGAKQLFVAQELIDRQASAASKGRGGATAADAGRGTGAWGRGRGAAVAPPPKVAPPAASSTAASSFESLSSRVANVLKDVHGALFFALYAAIKDAGLAAMKATLVTAVAALVPVTPYEKCPSIAADLMAFLDSEVFFSVAVGLSNNNPGIVLPRRENELIAALTLLSVTAKAKSLAEWLDAYWARHFHLLNGCVLTSLPRIEAVRCLGWIAKAFPFRVVDCPEAWPAISASIQSALWLPACRTQVLPLAPSVGKFPASFLPVYAAAGNPAAPAQMTIAYLSNDMAAMDLPSGCMHTTNRALPVVAEMIPTSAAGPLTLHTNRLGIIGNLFSISTGIPGASPFVVWVLDNLRLCQSLLAPVGPLLPETLDAGLEVLVQPVPETATTTAVSATPSGGLPPLPRRTLRVAPFSLLSLAQYFPNTNPAVLRVAPNATRKATVAGGKSNSDSDDGGKPGGGIRRGKGGLASPIESSHHWAPRARMEILLRICLPGLHSIHDAIRMGSLRLMGSVGVDVVAAISVDDQQSLRNGSRAESLVEGKIVPALAAILRRGASPMEVQHDALWCLSSWFSSSTNWFLSEAPLLSIVQAFSGLMMMTPSGVIRHMDPVAVVEAAPVRQPSPKPEGGRYIAPGSPAAAAGPTGASGPAVPKSPSRPESRMLVQLTTSATAASAIPSALVPWANVSWCCYLSFVIAKRLRGWLDDLMQVSSASSTETASSGSTPSKGGKPRAGSTGSSESDGSSLPSCVGLSSAGSHTSSQERKGFDGVSLALPVADVYSLMSPVGVMKTAIAILDSLRPFLSLDVADSTGNGNPTHVRRFLSSHPATVTTPPPGTIHAAHEMYRCRALQFAIQAAGCAMETLAVISNPIGTASLLANLSRITGQPVDASHKAELKALRDRSLPIVIATWSWLDAFLSEASLSPILRDAVCSAFGASLRESSFVSDAVLAAAASTVVSEGAAPTTIDGNALLHRVVVHLLRASQWQLQGMKDREAEIQAMVDAPPTATEAAAAEPPSVTPERVRSVVSILPSGIKHPGSMLSGLRALQSASAFIATHRSSSGIAGGAASLKTTVLDGVSEMLTHVDQSGGMGANAQPLSGSFLSLWKDEAALVLTLVTSSSRGA